MWDLNPHAIGHENLNLARLPIPTIPLIFARYFRANNNIHFYSCHVKSFFILCNLFIQMSIHTCFLIHLTLSGYHSFLTTRYLSILRKLIRAGICKWNLVSLLIHFLPSLIVFLHHLSCIGGAFLL